MGGPGCQRALAAKARGAGQQHARRISLLIENVIRGTSEVYFLQRPSNGNRSRYLDFIARIFTREQVRKRYKSPPSDPPPDQG